jgi:hypothetical protein
VEETVMMRGSKVSMSRLAYDPELDEERRRKQAMTTSDILSMPDMLELLIIHRRVGEVVLDQMPVSRHSWKARKVRVRSYCRMMVEDRAH